MLLDLFNPSYFIDTSHYTPPAPQVQIQVIEEVDCWCVAYAARKGVRVPIGWNAEDFPSNTTPHVGALALFRYKNGVAHVARITSLSEEGFTIDQDGVTRCNNPSDFVAWGDKNLTGFWIPEAATSTLITLN